MHKCIKTSASSADLANALATYTGRLVYPRGRNQTVYRCTGVQLAPDQRLVLVLYPVEVLPLPAVPRGLACLPPERRREIARAGGKASTGGFRSMSPTRRREVATRGGYARQARQVEAS